MKPHFLLMALLMLALAGCQHAGPPPRQSEIALTEHDNGRVVQLSHDATITLTLPTNPTTGYQWGTPQVQNPDVVKLVSTNYTPPASGAMGASGVTTFIFQTRGHGLSLVRMTYARPFAPQDHPSYFTFTVSARQGIKAD